MNKEEQQEWMEQTETLLRQERLSPEDAEAVQKLLEIVSELTAENKRLRTALVKANSNKPRMSSRLKDALYE
ncbi:hypothetical protein [Paenibacillus wulumuqiensis]|uniref:hypothetical protein n=1 Tax=Paenibacillus wulumuqiensis TaxID=1567107 RepID=UPI000619B785|nr:hypothetical protein [Paenibacillus wulumuqiensis]